MQNQKRESQRDRDAPRDYKFLQENIGEIDDNLLKMMPLLKNISRENLIPIIDFEDKTQIDLNYLVLHVYDCIPSVGFNKEEQSTVALRLPSDHSSDVMIINTLNLRKVTVSDIKKTLKHQSKKIHTPNNPFLNANDLNHSTQ